MNLKTRDLQSVLVEGGTEIAGAFVDAKLVDKLTFIVAPIVIGGHSAPLAIGGRGANSLENAMRLRDLQVIKHGTDFEFTGYPQSDAEKQVTVTEKQVSDVEKQQSDAKTQ